ncbi:hypothetical protein KJ564_12355 [bacterium]|nr:hypothetical protein [bacterium]
MERYNYVIASVISGFCLLFIILRYIWPKIFWVDDRTLIFIGIMVLPWLFFFLKKMKIPGVFEGETHERSQGTTSQPQPPKRIIVADPGDEELIPQSQKIIATLWKYQNQLFKNDPIKRWTFIVYPHAPEYPNFVKGLSQLFEKGLVAGDAKTQQIMLTNEGIGYLDSHTELKNHKDLYHF